MKDTIIEIATQMQAAARSNFKGTVLDCSPIDRLQADFIDRYKPYVPQRATCGECA